MARPKIDTARREEILQAFERCVVREGLARTSLQKVATEAGLPRSLVRYFVGNRDDMVSLLISRVMDRANNALRELSPSDQKPTLDVLLDFIYDGAFAHNTTNSVVDQLWQLAETDEAVRSELQSIYLQLRKSLVAGMTAEGIGASAAERTTTAQLLVALAYGEASFTQLGIKTGRKGSARAIAETVIAALPRSSRTQ